MEIIRTVDNRGCTDGPLRALRCSSTVQVGRVFGYFLACISWLAGGLSVDGQGKARQVIIIVMTRTMFVYMSSSLSRRWE